MPNLGLVDYSDSENSDTGVAPPTTTNNAKPPSKSAFEKVVDRSNPGKIRVRLPTNNEDLKRDEVGSGDEPPSKKPRIGGGGGAFSGFNSLLPAPKRTSQAAGAGLGKGPLGSKVQLKTGATPSFSREVDTPEAEPREQSISVEDGGKDGIKEEEAKGTVQQQDVSLDMTKPLPNELPEPELKKNTKPMMFKPLSVARNTQKKKKIVATPQPTATPPSNGGGADSKARVGPKVSLFSIDNSESATLASSSNGEYKPMIFESHQDNIPTSLNPTTEPSLGLDHKLPQRDNHQIDIPPSTGPQSLDSIAADLGLSESAKRQLFGRQKGSRQDQALSAVDVIHFNTDQEYATNEALRAAGEAVTHNPVRAIAPGKHSLKQLVNAANNQKNALEEHFATGRRNKKEAGSKYGW